VYLLHAADTCSQRILQHCLEHEVRSR
jgi:hypothetical protein